MRTRNLLAALLPLLILGCSDDTATVTPPPPPSLSAEDQQVVTYCRSLRDKLEAYAASHNGTYGGYGIANEAVLAPMENPYSGEIEPSGMRATAAGQIGLESYSCSGTVTGYRITGYGKDHMLITLESLGKVPAEVLSQHDVTVANALFVRETARLFAATNHGVFSTDVAGDTNQDGKTLQDLLPGGQLLVNPFTSSRTEPQDGLGLAIPGGVGYLGADSGSGSIDSYTIEAYGCDGDIILTLVPYTQYGEIIWQGCNYLRAAVEQFGSTTGRFPRDLDTETTPGGKTVLDLISDMTSDHVPYFVNPYNQAHYVPTLGIASGNCTLAYQPIETAGVISDFVITGRVGLEEIVRYSKRPLP